MSRITWPDKYSSEGPTPGVDWTPRLRLGESIEPDSADFEPIDGADVVVANITEDLDNNTTYCDITGGTPGTTQWVKATIMTTEGRFLMEICTFQILIETYD